MFKAKCIRCNGEPTGSRDYPPNRNRGRKKPHGTEGVKSDRGTEAACRITVCALPIPSREGGKSSRERGAMWSMPSGFSVSRDTQTDFMPISGADVGTLKWQRCARELLQRCRAFLPCTWRRAAWVGRDMWWRSCGHVLHFKHGAWNEVFLGF